MTHVLHIHTTICKKCLSIHQESHLYEITELKPGYRHLIRAITSPAYRPEIVHLPNEFQEACHECVSMLPPLPADIRTWIPLRWRDIERQKMENQKATRETTLEELA